MLTIPKPWLILLACAWTQGIASAQIVLRDPTTPPPGVMKPAGAVAGSDVSADTQSVIRITPVGGRQKLTVDGRPLQAGEQIKQWRVVTITSNRVIFKDSRGTRSVPVPTSSVSKKPAAVSASAK